MAQEFRHLFSPLKIGSMTVRNRIYSSPHGTFYNERLVGPPNERMIQYWVAKAKGGTAMIGSQITEVHARKERNIFHRPGMVEAFKKATDAVHQYGAKLIWQIGHTGGQGGGFLDTPWAPSVIPFPEGNMRRYIPHEMTKDEIKATVDAFAHAATVAREAGVDGAEIHAGHGYLIGQFMSPYTNRRADEYGGNLENRMRFPLEVIEAVRGAVGDDFVVGIRASAEEFVEGGYTLDDFLVMAPMLTKTGKLDFLNVTAGIYEGSLTRFRPSRSWLTIRQIW